MVDFFEAGHDGALPDGFAVWRRGVTYTVRPEMQSPLSRGREYRTNATVRRRAEKDGEFTVYEDLYERCIKILDGRIDGLERRDGDQPPHTWVLWQAWWCGAISDKYPSAGDGKVACASITMGLVVPAGEHKPEGERRPTREQLTQPGGMMEEPTSHFDEIYIDFDFRDPSAVCADVTVSYGEYIPDEGIALEPFLLRAERLAKFDQSLEVVRREWFCITHSRFAVAMIYGRQ